MIASVSGAIYIESDAGDILWGAASSSALHPRAVPLPAELPAGGTEWVTRGGCLCMGWDLATGLGDAEILCLELLVREGVRVSAAVQRMATAIELPSAHHLKDCWCVPCPRAPRGGRSFRSTVGHESVAVPFRGIRSLRQASTGDDLLRRLQNAIGLLGWGRR